jgi:orotidine-5'-phosphate decarboxylase
LDRRPLARKTGIIHALDVEDLSVAIRIAKLVEPYVDAIKLPWLLVMGNGASALDRVKREIRVPVIADFKVADIPEISSNIVQKAVQSGADGITLHGFVGRDTVEKCINAAHENSAYTFVVTEMSHPGAERFMQPVGVEIARLARELGSDGIVAPATRPERTREYRKIVGDGVTIMSPGVGAQGAKIGDAVRAGADYEIIGRRIYQAQDPAGAAKEAAEIMSQLPHHGKIKQI